MELLLEQLARVAKEEMGTVLDETLLRYRMLYPDWEIGVFSIDKRKDRNAQIDEMIVLLQRMKQSE